MMFRRLLAVSAVALPLSACSGLDLLNATVSDDGHVSRTGLRYADGPRGLLDIHKPPGDGPFPVVVWIYGGAWEDGDRAGYEFIGAQLARAGFLVVIPDYRVHPEVVFPAFLRDNARAVAWTQTHVAEYGGDPGRMALMGHSAGAYNAAMLGYDDTWIRQAGGDPDALDAFVGLAGPYDIHPYTVEVSRTIFGHETDPATTEPLDDVDAADPPALLLHGTDDTTVKPEHTTNFAEALRAAGVPVTVERVAGTGHIGLLLDVSPTFEDDAVSGAVERFLRQRL
ncbi:carboxylesterase family protein [Caenispirillum salinarum AK4]|uniref:Carboxylesterase family protein n=1 Tax=Caenispirillum salinarum AK4 TaxID=1238182 RepID=K9H282_9PROT|nr:alpha/beta hydrolase [Caenispirillum salinarum]EKV32395.1 carboxylesterase family protein [Caenispirillum salinarum AK4]